MWSNILLIRHNLLNQSEWAIWSSNREYISKVTFIHCAHTKHKFLQTKAKLLVDAWMTWLHWNVNVHQLSTNCIMLTSALFIPQINKAVVIFSMPNLSIKGNKGVNTAMFSFKKMSLNSELLSLFIYLFSQIRLDIDMQKQTHKRTGKVLKAPDITSPLEFLYWVKSRPHSLCECSSLHCSLVVHTRMPFVLLGTVNCWELLRIHEQARVASNHTEQLSSVKVGLQ